jgi:hypothetical protein
MSRASTTLTFHETADGPLTVGTHRFVWDPSQYADVAIVIASLATGVATADLFGSPLPFGHPLLADLDPTTNTRWAALPLTTLSISGISGDFGSVAENAIRAMQLAVTVTTEVAEPSVVISLAERS